MLSCDWVNAITFDVEVEGRPQRLTMLAVASYVDRAVYDPTQHLADLANVSCHALSVIVWIISVTLSSSSSEPRCSYS